MNIRFKDYAEEHDIEPDDKNYASWVHGYDCGAFKFKIVLLQWCNERKKIDLKAAFMPQAVDAWNQIDKKLKGR